MQLDWSIQQIIQRQHMSPIKTFPFLPILAEGLSTGLWLVREGPHLTQSTELNWHSWLETQLGESNHVRWSVLLQKERDLEVEVENYLVQKLLLSVITCCWRSRFHPYRRALVFIQKTLYWLTCSCWQSSLGYHLNQQVYTPLTLVS